MHSIHSNRSFLNIAEFRISEVLVPSEIIPVAGNRRQGVGALHMRFTLINLIEHGASTVNSHRLLFAKFGVRDSLQRLQDSYAAFHRLALLMLPGLECNVGHVGAAAQASGSISSRDAEYAAIFARFEHLLVLLNEAASQQQRPASPRSNAPSIRRFDPSHAAPQHAAPQREATPHAPVAQPSLPGVFITRITDLSAPPQ